MESVEEMCDYIALINLSNKVLDGEINQIKHQFKSGKYFAEIENISIENQNRFQSEFDLEVISDAENSFRFNIAKPDNMSSNELLMKLTQLGHITQFKEAIPSMNEVFLKAVQSS